MAIRTPSCGKTLLITNDFPPRPGGIQAFVHNLALRQPPDSLTVLASTFPGAEAFDAAQPFEVIREDTGLLLPTPGVARRAGAIARAKGCDTVWFGAAAPLGLLAAGLRRRAGIRRVVAQTHGHEIGWAALPGARTLLRRIAYDTDVLTFLGEYTRTRLASQVAGLTNLARLAPGVDTTMFTPTVDGSGVRRRYGLVDRPVVVCVSRLVPRKGQDTLIRAWPAIRARVPEAALLIVGGGPYRPTLERLAAGSREIVFTGEVAWEELPAHFAAGDVYAMPCRTRRGGLDVEGLGIVYLEASAVGLPVVVGRSGGAPDAVQDGQTGLLVDGDDRGDVADKISWLLGDPGRARALGAAGRAWVEAEWGWEKQAARMRDLLSASAPIG